MKDQCNNVICLKIHNSCCDYKLTKAAEGVDWSTVKTKKEEAVAEFKERYPKTTSSQYPHTGDVFSKERLWKKLKQIVSGRSGGRKIVTMFFDECVKNGIESCR